LRYLARLPTRSAESGSLALCAAYFLSLPSDPAVTSNALAIQIIFPLIRVTPASCNRPGLPAPLGKPIKGRSISYIYSCLYLIGLKCVTLCTSKEPILKTEMNHINTDV